MFLGFWWVNTLIARWKILSCFAVYNWKNNLRSTSVQRNVNSCRLMKDKNLKLQIPAHCKVQWKNLRFFFRGWWDVLLQGQSVPHQTLTDPFIPSEEKPLSEIEMLRTQNPSVITISWRVLNISHVHLLSMAGPKHFILNHVMQIILISQGLCDFSYVILMLSFVFENSWHQYPAVWIFQFGSTSNFSVLLN